MNTTFAIPPHIRIIADELKIRPGQISRTAALLADGATVPFISRYRKEATDGLDEVAVQSIKEGIERLETLEKRRGTVLETIEAQVVQVQVVSASELSTESRAQIEAQVGEMLEYPIEVRYRVDPALIAGATLRFGDTVIDGSLSGQLQTLTDRYLAESGQEAA